MGGELGIFWIEMRDVFRYVQIYTVLTWLGNLRGGCLVLIFYD